MLFHVWSATEAENREEETSMAEHAPKDKKRIERLAIENSSGEGGPFDRDHDVAPSQMAPLRASRMIPTDRASRALRRFLMTVIRADGAAGVERIKSDSTAAVIAIVPPESIQGAGCSKEQLRSVPAGMIDQGLGRKDLSGRRRHR